MLRLGWSINRNTGDDDDTPLSVFIKPADETGAAPRPSEIDRFYVETEYSHAEEEQRHAYTAKAAEESRPPATRAAELAHEADMATEASARANSRAKEASARLGAAHEVLGPLRRRPRDGKILKYLRWSLLLVGDIGGITGAALMLGEEPAYALFQATSAAVAAVTLGAVGREVRYVLSARTRRKELSDLTKQEESFASFFVSPNLAETLVKILVLTCATGMLLIATAIYALREATEGSAAGLTFGCIALALGIASFYNSFDTADDVAEFLDHEAAIAKKAEKEAAASRAVSVIGARAAALTEVDSVVVQNRAEAESAAAAIRRRLYKVLGDSPGVAGNGTAMAKPSMPAETNGAMPKEHVRRSRSAKS